MSANKCMVYELLREVGESARKLQEILKSYEQVRSRLGSVDSCGDGKQLTSSLFKTFNLELSINFFLGSLGLLYRQVNTRESRNIGRQWWVATVILLFLSFNFPLKDDLKVKLLSETALVVV